MNSRTRFALAAIAVLALFAVSHPLPAQGNGTSDQPECRQAAQRLHAYDQSVIQSGGHANEGNGKQEQRQIDAARLLTCGAGGGIDAAATITQTRLLTDTSALDELVGPFRNFRDTAVVNAAMAVADDPTAAVPARVFALRTLWIIASGKYWMGYEELLPTDAATDAAPAARCGSGVALTDAAPYWVVGAEPAAGFEAQIRALAERLRTDASQPLPVRAAATCALR